MTSCWNDVKEVSFGGTVLNRLPYVIDNLNIFSSPSRTISRLPRLVREGSIITNRRDEEKTVLLEGRILAGRRPGIRASKMQIEGYLDSLQLALAKGPQILKVGYDDGRYYPEAELLEEVTATWNLYNGNPWEMSWQAQMLCVDPFLQSVAQESLSNAAALTLFSAGVYRKFIDATPLGTAPSRPVITITVPAGGPYGLSQIYVENASSSVDTIQRLTVARTYAANDILVIDCEEQTVKVNGNNVGFSGYFPELDPRFDTFNRMWLYANATSTPTLTYALDWYKRWR